MSRLCLVLALVAALGFVALPASAGPVDEHASPAPAPNHGVQEGAEEHAGPTSAHPDSPDGHEGEHDAHGEHFRNGLALFIGGTLVPADDETYYTIAAEYERRFSDRWGVQVVGEYVRDFDAWVVTAPVAFRVVDTLWILAGPGLEIDPRRRRPGLPGIGPEAVVRSVDSHEEEGPHFLWRFGLGYGIHLSHTVSLFPSFSLDLVREHGHWEEAWVLGVGLTYHF